MAERKFIEQHPVYSTMTNLGTPTLAKVLNRELVKHVARELPALRNRVSGQLHRIKRDLEELQVVGEDFSQSSKTAQGAILLQILIKFSNDFSQMLEGTCKDAVCTELKGGARINFIFQEIYKPAIQQLSPLYSLSDEEIRMAMRNSHGTGSWLFIPETSFERLAQRQIAQLEEASIQVAELIYTEMLNLTGECEIKDIRHFQKLPEELVGVVKGLLGEFMDPCKVLDVISTCLSSDTIA